MTANTTGKKAASHRSTARRGSTSTRARGAKTPELRFCTVLAPNAPWYTKEQMEAKPTPKPKPPKPAPTPVKKVWVPKQQPMAKEFDPATVLTWTKPKLKL